MIPVGVRMRSAASLLAVLLGASSCAPASAEFGRLFFSAEERRALDAPPPPAAPAPAPPPTPVPRQIHGFLQRPDGRLIVWLDGMADSGLAMHTDFRLHPRLVLAPRAAPQLRLRIGDHWPPLPAADAVSPLPTVQFHPAAKRTP